jgi:hypothetical protein
METDQENQLFNLCEFATSQNLELKYRASRDGFKASDFHSHCEGIANTITVIKARSGNIFGGFTEQAWHSRGEDVTDPKAFLFSLVNKEKKPFMVMCSNEGENAIYCESEFGPCFGRDDDNTADIWIESDSNINEDSSCDFGYSYQHPDYERDTDEARNILAGSNYFETVEIEVYAQSN